MASAEQNIETVRLIIEQLNHRDLTWTNGLAVNFIEHRPHRDIKGPDAMRRYYEEIFGGYPNSEWALNDIFATADRVAYRWTWTGTHTGTLFGMEATGKDVSGSGLCVAHLVNGEVAEAWTNPDDLGILSALGAIEVRAPRRAA